MDNDSTLWVLSNRLPRVIYGTLDYSLFNFNVFKLNPNEIIKGTACAQKVALNSPNAGNEIGVGGEFQKVPTYYGGITFASSAAAASSSAFISRSIL